MKASERTIAWGVGQMEQCPNGCGEMTEARYKDLELEDGKGNSVMITIYYEWCPECYFENNIWTG
ncbi:hypothetical protein [Paenibacillus oleatilyticus]|uniref:hypothetical protein n=1 Tax=Paenibacillus oleatilyticus TaxID=2594886 RepID=UPI001C1FD509|nr:hypothetical protein [Paenibacillus oleatilyticus]MBU7315950.1 hypothetical protein [Paenibacillus oleatilyticus]